MEYWLVFEDWFIWIALAVAFVGSILAGLLLNYSYRQGREEYIELEEYKENKKQ